ncbi:hypothetical protein AKJ52_02625 [candidate division MSBL1 archaeon SCGC-AAA382C18]|uniref:DUF5615 domain-containing protein n=1 Tax=candidate division MSBL1 archaeon SCGC-AAA382C18 TaxID=1698281 RepID=A0A133VHZ7_9EURY|nr:hypothetical protein AKJ52_02625 [candidate division MSBL1 archaeon SCGC-AAA382C18]
MGGKIEVYTDESVSPAIAKGLRRRGLEATDAREVNNIGLTDEEQLKYVKNNDFVLFTYDDDFVRIARKKNIKHPGIIYCDQRKYSIGEIIRKISKIVETNQPTDLENKVKYL